MKKFISIVIVAVLALSMAACGADKSADSEVKTESENNAVSSQQEEKDEALFDTSWARNEFEALMPELPFTGWKTSQDGNTYKMELGGLKDAAVTDADGKTIGYGEDKEVLISYLESLKAYGFTVEETGGIEGYEYEWQIKDAAGNEIEVTCAEGYCWIEIEKK